MARFKNLGLQTKTLLLIVSANALVLFFLLLGVDFLASRMFQGQAVDRITSLGTLLSDHCAISLTFKDDQEATRALNALYAYETITSAIVYTTEGELFARYLRQG